MRNHNTQLVRKTIQENANLRVLRSRMARDRTQICKMKNELGEIVTGKADIVATIQGFYRGLYSVSVPRPDDMGNEERQNIMNVGSEEIPEIDRSCEEALMKMKNGKAPGEDRVTSEILKMGGKSLEGALLVLLNR